MNHNNTILVVDDDSHSLRLLTDTLTGGGYRVRPADSGELALASVGAVAPGLILLDIRMPGMDGFEVCRRLKANDKSRGIPVIFLSAAGQVEDRVLGLSLGAADFISKPFQAPELLARVHIHMELGRLRADLEQQVAERTAELRLANERLCLELEERRRAERELRESEERFRNLANRAPVGIWVTDADRLVTFYNRRALAFLGRKTADLAAPVDRFRASRRSRNGSCQVSFGRSCPPEFPHRMPGAPHQREIPLDAAHRNPAFHRRRL